MAFIELSKHNAPCRGKTSVRVNRLGFCLFLLFLTYYIPTAMGAEILESGPTMRLEGTYSFSASSSGDTITWNVDRKVNNTVSNGIYTTNGPTAEFDLDWRSGNTTYIIRAEDNGVEDELQIQVFPPDQGISYTFKNPYRNSPAIMVRMLVPSSLNPDTPVISVHHGSSRANYFNYWKNWGMQTGWIILAPHFPDSGQWGGSRGYNLGNMFTGREGTGSLQSEEKWSYRIAVDFAMSILEGFDLNDQTFDMWGHSAGGQFTHRTMLFVRDAPIRRGMPANPGWWTLPVNENSRNYKYPYGLYHPSLDYGEDDIQRFTNMHGVINAGDRDTRRTDSLRQTPEADAQGRNRWLRANNMHTEIQEATLNNNWEFYRVNDVDHNGEKMAQAAQEWLEANPPLPPPAPEESLLYFSLRKNGTVGGQAVSTSDIVAFDGNNFTVAFDGSEFGLDGARVNAITVLNETDILMTFYPAVSLPIDSGTLNITPTDIVMFTASTGTFQHYLDGSAAGLNQANQQIDAMAIDKNGKLLISVAKTFFSKGVKIRDEDLILEPAAAGDAWKILFDGSDANLETTGWDVKGTAMDETGKIYLSMRNAFSVPQLSGENDDVFLFKPTQLGPNTIGTYNPSLFFDGSAYGLTANDISALDILPVSTP